MVRVGVALQDVKESVDVEEIVIFMLQLRISLVLMGNLFLHLFLLPYLLSSSFNLVNRTYAIWLAGAIWRMFLWFVPLGLIILILGRTTVVHGGRTLVVLRVVGWGAVVAATLAIVLTATLVPALAAVLWVFGAFVALWRVMLSGIVWGAIDLNLSFILSHFVIILWCLILLLDLRVIFIRRRGCLILFLRCFVILRFCLVLGCLLKLRFVCINLRKFLWWRTMIAVILWLFSSWLLWSFISWWLGFFVLRLIRLFYVRLDWLWLARLREYI